MCNKPRHASPLSRLTAALGMALVVLLTALAASPEWHTWVHGSEDTAAHAGHDHEPGGNADHQCAVTLFSQGVTGLLIVCLLLLARPRTRSIVLRTTDEVAVARPRYWLVPSHAPPLA